MKLSDTPIVRRRLRATLWTALAALLPISAYAESVVFNADFVGGTNTVSVNPSVITPTGTTFCGMYNKANGALAVNEFGVVLSGPGSSSAAIEFAGRVTQAPITLAQVGDYIELTGSFYTAGLTNIAIGLFNSGAVDPLVTRSDGVTAMLNNGLGAAATVNLTGGTRGWTGYRALSTGGSANASFVARTAQTSTTAPLGYELLSVGTGAFGTPAAITVGTLVNSPSIMVWKTENGLTAYKVLYRIQRISATEFGFTYTFTNLDTSTVVYSSTGSTVGTSTNAINSKPAVVATAFDSIGIGGRVDTSATAPASPVTSVNVQFTSLKVTAGNADIAKITTQPTNQNFPVNQPGSLSVVASGTGTLSYQWFKDGSPLSGATSATYNVASASASDNGNYYVVVSNSYGSETSATVAVNVSTLSAPVITTQPTAQTVDAGTTLTLTAAASGVPTPSYQWYRNNSQIPGATLATYIVASALEADAGDYKVIATNSQGSAPSNTVTVTINTAAPVITVPPAPVTVNVGQAINLAVTATGFPAPTYQWYRNTTAILGATASTYSIASATTADAGTYTVTATNPYGAPTSGGALVTVNVVAPSVTTQPPATLTVQYGKRTTLIAAYAGSAPLTYQWFKDTAPISGATSSTYVIASATPTDAGAYHVVVTNEGSSATSTDTVVSVVFANETSVFATNFAADTLNNAATPISSSSTSWFIMSGRTATNCSVGDDATTVDVVEARPLTVTWVTPAGSAVVETAARFSATPVALSATGEYLRLRATMSGTNILNLCFGLFNSGGVSPLPLDGSVGGATMSTSESVGLGTQNWIGYRSAMTVNGTNTDIGTRPPQIETATNRGQELVFPAGSTGAAFGQPAGVAAGVLPGLGATVAITNGAVYTLDYTITLSGANQYTIAYSLYAGSSATGTPLYTTNATTTAAGAKPSAVTTEFDALAIGLRNLDGATSPTLVITDLSVVKGSSVAGAVPAITTQPASQTLAPGTTLTLTAAASGTPAPTFQWYKNDVLISGATSATYTIASVGSNDNGDYKVIATNALGSSAPSNIATVIVGSVNGYVTWAGGQGFTVGVNDGKTQDPDNDGVNNLLEFVLGGNPLSSSPAILPVATYSGANLVLTFNIKVAAKADYTIGAESSTDLAAWATVSHGVGGASVVETVLNGTTNHVVVTVPSAGAKTFLRVKVSPKP